MIVALLFLIFWRKIISIILGLLWHYLSIIFFETYLCTLAMKFISIPFTFQRYWLWRLIWRRKDKNDGARKWCFEFKFANSWGKISCLDFETFCNFLLLTFKSFPNLSFEHYRPFEEVLSLEVVNLLELQNFHDFNGVSFEKCLVNYGR